MVFSSIMFLTRFLPLVLIVYFLVPGCMKNTWRNLVLFMFSLAFYAWGEPVYIWLMIFSTVVDYVNGGLAGYFVARDKRNTAKVFVGLSVVINLTLLAVFKYAGKFVLPIGISFYTFQSMSYTIDVYRGKAKAEKNPINFGAYISLFPQLIAGPIVRFSDIATQLRERTINLESIRYGMLRFVCGLGKKVLLANQAGEIFQTIANYKVSQMTTVSAWLGILAFMFQIYFDFSGYSDMAIGLMAVFGFEIPENFKYPYEAKSITEFWRRWHISLGNWFKEYVYIPLGGSRKGNARTFLNIFIVWFLTGLWHGAAWNFIVWGIYYGVVLVLEKYVWGAIVDRWPSVLQHIYALVLVLVGWVFFFSPSLGAALRYLFAMVGGGAGFASKEVFFVILTHWLFYLLAVIGSTTLGSRMLRAILNVSENHTVRTVITLVVFFGMLVISVAYLIADTYNPFLYFRF